MAAETAVLLWKLQNSTEMPVSDVDEPQSLCHLRKRRHNYFIVAMRFFGQKQLRENRNSLKMQNKGSFTHDVLRRRAAPRTAARRRICSVRGP